MMPVLVAALVLTLLGAALLWLSGRQREASGLPAGEVVYSDTDQWKPLEKPLRSRRFGLVGRPDYLVEVRQGRRRMTIPVEVKSRKRPAQPYASHILQLAAYCLLVEENFDTPPAYGLLHYADATLRIPFTETLRDQVLDIADNIRAARQAQDLAPNHAEPARCVACGYRSACGSQALA